MAFRKKLFNGFTVTTDRFKKTRLYIMENGHWVAGNVSSFIDLLSTGVRTAATSVSARNAAVDISNAIEDYACSDYKCFALDTAATACDVAGAIVAFISSGNLTKKVFVGTSSFSCFCRTLRNKCKEKNVFGCN